MSPATRDNAATLLRARTSRLPQRPSSCLNTFRWIVGSCETALRDRRQRAIARDVDAIHAMRAALTRLRGAALFFDPWIDAGEWAPIERELAWLKAALG